MAGRRLGVRNPRLAMTVAHTDLDNRELVYAISAGNRLSYPLGRSKIAYIGATKTGSNRILQSAAARADSILDLDGVRSFKVHIVSCQPMSDVRTWLKLERAMLLEFRSLYGEIPICNVHAGTMREFDEFEIFSRDRIQNVLLRLEE